MTFDISKLQFNSDGLIPVVVQDVSTKDVLMLAYMNQVAIEETLNSGQATYYSRSRQSLWKKAKPRDTFKPCMRSAMIAMKIRYY